MQTPPENLPTHRRPSTPPTSRLRGWLSCLLATVVLSAGATTAHATVFEVGPDGTLQSILTGTLADGDLIRVPADAGSDTDINTTITITENISIVGEGPGFSRIDNAAATAIDFLVVEASMRIEGVTLKGFGDAITLDPPASTSITFDARSIQILDGDRGIVGAQEGNDTDRLERVSIKDSRFHDLDNAAIYLDTRNIDSAEIAGNYIQNVGLAGVYVGRDGIASDLDAYARSIQIYGNHIQEVKERQQGNFHRYFAICVLGREATIRGNVIRDLQDDENLYKPQGNGDSYVAIYTKAAYTVISDNVIREPGPGYAIDLKGISRGSDPVESPSYSSIISNNQIFISDPTGKRHSGIKTNVEDVTIIGNHVEGASQEGILVQAVAPDDVSVIGNTVILGSSNVGLGYGLNVQTNLTTIPNPGTRRILATNNRFVGIAAGSDIVNREYNGTIWQVQPLPTAAGEWVVDNNIRH
ncbi:MAG: hypothetical protein AAGD01_20520 [Acidobacteriota bacterium]